MRLDPKAGACGPKLGQRHDWGKERPHFHGVTTWQNKQPCQHCNRWRVIEYTRRGNHVAGYFTA